MLSSIHKDGYNLADTVRLKLRSDDEKEKIKIWREALAVSRQLKQINRDGKAQ